MTTFMLMRHGQADYSGPTSWGTRGWGSDLAPLSDMGVQQVATQLPTIKEFNPDIVISSPMTRAVQTAMVLRDGLRVPFRVEFDLHEWVPDRTFQWRTLSEIDALQADYRRCNGMYPPGETKPWETSGAVRLRVLEVLRRYQDYARVLVVCHGEVIWALTGVEKLDLAGVVPFELEAPYG